MLILKIFSMDGVPPARPLQASFGEAGGTIGRADTNHLVLPDPSRHISRVHARVLCSAGGGHELVNEGANPIGHNGRPLGNGQRAPLAPGDRLRIGGYELVAADTPEDPATLIGARAGAAPADPFGDAGAAPAAARSPFTPDAADPLGLNLPAAPVAALGRKATAPGVIPDDFDVFADPVQRGRAAATPAPAPAQDLAEQFDLGLGRRGSAALSIDKVFDLEPGADPLAHGPLAAPVPGPAMEPLDPLTPWNGPPAPVAPAPVSDHVPAIRGAFTPLPVQVGAERAGTPAQASGAGAFFSWETAPPATVVAPAAPVPAAPPAAAAAPVPRMAPVPMPAPMPAPAPVAAATAAAAAAPAPRAAADDLTQAFLRGAGVPALPLPPLTAEAMHDVGALLREAAQGTLDLLAARAVTKRDVRAEVTTIATRDNNPLKFSPNVEVALSALLAPRGSGFLAPVASMRDAYDDLRSHQLGIVAGMRAALAAVLRRFDPQELEKHLAEKSLLDSVLPMNRRSRLWSDYERFYREIAAEAEDDFHSLFGREFLRAYEAQMDRLADAARDAPAPDEPERRRHGA